MKTEEYIAHINEITGEIQTVHEHNINTGKLARNFCCAEFADMAELIGRYHDIGKYLPAFQKRIRGCSNEKVDHSICGAKELENVKEKLSGPELYMLEACIAGHHSGIPDFGTRADKDSSTLLGRLNQDIDEKSYAVYKDDEKDYYPDYKRMTESFSRYMNEDCFRDNEHFTYDIRLMKDKYAFLTRYLFSCLTDADSIDTALFCSGEINQELKADFNDCLEKINKRFLSFRPVTKLQKTRADIQNVVFSHIGEEAKMYFLPMPTGSGKTLCSMKFALERAIRTGKKHIIYVIPYNSIIDQTVDEFTEIFGKDNFVLRHQSTYSYDDNDISEDYRDQIKHSTENWNASIIVTTQVQFFESIYGDKRRQLRRLHNIADSMLIFDEAHMLPVEYLQPCLESVAFLTKYYGCEAIMLSATMPDYSEFIQKYAIYGLKMKNLISGNDKIPGMINAFNKCTFSQIGAVSSERLVNDASKYATSLIIVNRRKDAQTLFDMTKGRGKVYHLSTYMTAYDRKRVISDIKAYTKELETDYHEFSEVPEERKLMVISTSLIEAGVDLDFAAVFREMSGLDDILQSGGRCNREGKREHSVTFIFEFDRGGGKPICEIKESITMGILKKYSADISSLWR